MYTNEKILLLVLTITEAEAINSCKQPQEIVETMVVIVFYVRFDVIDSIATFLSVKLFCNFGTRSLISATLFTLKETK